jgi:hypothetical protein
MAAIATAATEGQDSVERIQRSVRAGRVKIRAFSVACRGDRREFELHVNGGRVITFTAPTECVTMPFLWSLIADPRREPVSGVRLRCIAEDDTRAEPALGTRHGGRSLGSQSTLTAPVRPAETRRDAFVLVVLGIFALPAALLLIWATCAVLARAFGTP